VSDYWKRLKWILILKFFFVGFYFAAEKADTERAGRGGVKKGPKRMTSFRNLGQE